MGWTVSREQHHSFIMQRGRSRSNSPLPPPLNWNWRRFSRSRTPSSPRSPPTPWSESNRSDSPGPLLRFRKRASKQGESQWLRFVRLGGGAHDTTQGNPAANFVTGTPHIDRSCFAIFTNRPIWRQQLPWQPVRWRITRFDRHDMNPQEGARFVHDLVNLHHGHFWLHMTHELLTVDCLCNFRDNLPSCSQMLGHESTGAGQEDGCGAASGHWFMLRGISIMFRARKDLTAMLCSRATCGTKHRSTGYSTINMSSTQVVAAISIGTSTGP